MQVPAVSVPPTFWSRPWPGSRRMRPARCSSSPSRSARALLLAALAPSHAADHGATPHHCKTAGRLDAHRLSPPRFCNAFADAAQCHRHFTPRGPCLWDVTACGTDRRCHQRGLAHTGDSYLFFKFHKVGSSTVGGTLRLALMAATADPFVSCLRHSKLRNKTAVERARYTNCSLCAKHDNSLPLLPAFRAALDTPAEGRLRAMFASPKAAAVLDAVCPQRASAANRLRTGTVIRRPVDRVISKYFFLRTYCVEKAKRWGGRYSGCAAAELELVPWLYAGSGGPLDVANRTGLFHGNDEKVSCEVLAGLGDGGCTDASVAVAKRTVDAIDVVGITEMMDASMVLFSERWRLPLPDVQQSYVSLLINPTKRPVSDEVRGLIAAHPAVARETRLYEYALARLRRDLEAVPHLSAKLASIRAAAMACSLSGSCSAGSLGAELPAE